jgi:DNA polymerase III alpha subunit
VVRVAGIVTHRQRPETASGVIFMSLEDESDISNLIVWPSVQVRQRESVFGPRMMLARGELQNEMNVVHVIALTMRDYSHWLGRIQQPLRPRALHKRICLTAPSTHEHTLAQSDPRIPVYKLGCRKCWPYRGYVSRDL